MKSLLSVLILLGCLAPFPVRALSDIDEYQYKSAIELLASRGIINGYDDGTFQPNKPINRAEFLKLLMLSVYGNQVNQVPSSRCFADFVTYQWFWPHACAAKELGIIEGHPDGTFRGEDTIILAEALKMSLEAWQVTLDAEDADKPWYDRYMRAAASRNIFRRFPYTPEYQLTRGEMAQLLVMIGEPIAVVDPTIVVVPTPVKAGICGDGVVEGAEQCDDGNTQTGDGCSDICIIVPEPIRHGALRIEQQAIANNVQTSGNNDVPLMAFTALAGRQDVYITTLKFKRTAGSLTFGENYRLFIDDKLYGRATANGETLAFTNLNILVKDGYYTRIELWGDVDTTLSAGSIAVGFDTSQPDFVDGVDKIDGADVSGIILNGGKCMQEDVCWITVITSDDQEIAIQTKGNLYVTAGSTPLGPRQVIASTQTPSLLNVKFRSDGESILVKEFAVEGVPSSVDYLQMYKAGSASPFATMKKIYCTEVTTGRFCADNEFIIPQNGEENITINARLLSDSQGAQSNQSISLTVGSVEAQGQYSGQQLLQNNEIFISSIVSPTHTVALAKIISIQNTNPDADNTLIPAGTTTFAQYTFRAADHNNGNGGYNTADINTLVFTVSAVNMEFDQDSFYLFNTQNSGVIHACSATGSTGTITVTCTGMIAAQLSTTIARGSTLELGLRGTITSAQVAPGTSVLQTSLNNLSNPSLTGTIEWSDGVTTFDWVDIGTTQVKNTVYRLN
ncbi:MAG: S-layer homology domain-containing protein [Candidatus Peregrinibacteria bacterium]|nr:S-layer homology domain-containing protein [Candidatus Peregrinibacteria bacterium]MCB9808737.1 S-layer homology domain-containing protein [Candidatus Peribacteria bacterium]